MARRENAKPDDMSAGGRTVPDNRRVPESVWLRGATIALTLSGWRLLEYSLARLSADNCDAGGGIHASGSTNEFRNRYRCQCGPVRLALTVPPLGSRARRVRSGGRFCWACAPRPAAATTRLNNQSVLSSATDSGRSGLSGAAATNWNTRTCPQIQRAQRKPSTQQE
jgi:hypothetical protein